jgi:hypothetical protein
MRQVKHKPRKVSKKDKFFKTCVAFLKENNQLTELPLELGKNKGRIYIFL